MSDVREDCGGFAGRRRGQECTRAATGEDEEDEAGEAARVAESSLGAAPSRT